jgi:N-carbamoyl-L-amino-acid hydrolase
MTLAGNARIDSGRLWASLMEMAKIGSTPKGGCNRQTLTDLDRQGRELFSRWCKEAGLTVGVDGIGNMFGRRPGADPKLAPVMAGSHLDTQPTGGKFDGVLGVLGALEMVRTLNDLGIRTRHPIEIANWTNEEGARFAPSMIASGVFAGKLDKDFAFSRKDAEGKLFGEELKRIGYVGPEPIGGRPLHAYFELHIEQGPILEDENIDIGVVTDGQGLKWINVTITGYESHAGTTPMPRRRDAGRGAARFIELVNAVAVASGPVGVGTVGRVVTYPGTTNIIPGRVDLTVDIRHPDGAALSRMEEELRSGAKRIADELKLEIELETISNYAPVPFDPECVGMVRKAAERLGYTHRDIVSGAGHDACYIAGMAPTAMIFTPCVNGVSHNEEEDISPEWAAAGANVLLHAVLASAGIAE